MKIINQQKILTNALKTKGASLVGYADISILNTYLSDKYPTAISLCVKYDDSFVDLWKLKNEENYHDSLTKLNPTMNEIIDTCTDQLKQWGYGYKAIPIAIPIKNEKQLNEINCFSHKFAATRAGLGWIGKSSLLITPEFGPKVKLCTVLTNGKFETGNPVETSKCNSCNLCFKACPFNAIKSHDWHIGIERDKLFDAHICNNKRLNAIHVIGRKSACGNCIQACLKGSHWKK